MGYDPLRVQYLNSGEYVLVAGTGKICSLHTKDGIRLGLIGEPQKSWIWCCCASPLGEYVVKNFLSVASILFDISSALIEILSYILCEIT